MFKINERTYICNIDKNEKVVLPKHKRPVTHHVRYKCEAVILPKQRPGTSHSKLNPLDHLKYIQKLKRIASNNRNI